MNDDRNAPATKGDIEDLRAELKADLGDLRADIRATESRLVENFRDIQTELLKAFYSFTESNRQRVAQLEGNQGALINRTGTLEDRVTDLERKVNFPEHPQQ
jgi:DNA repair exonuclease SbcCD ATPase subunit